MSGAARPSDYEGLDDIINLNAFAAERVSLLLRFLACKLREIAAQHHAGENNEAETRSSGSESEGRI